MRRKVWIVIAACVFAGWAFSRTVAEPEQSAKIDSNCRLIRMQPNGLLLACDQRMVSLQLKLDNVSRATRFTPDGLFHFDCPIEQMCADQPRIDGWMILQKAWLTSRQDEAAIYDALRLPPVVKGPENSSEEPLPASSQSACGTFPIYLGGLPGVGACYEGSDESATIAIIAAAPEIGFAILFHQNSGGWQALRDSALKLSTSFKLQRAEGDIQLMQWMR